MWETMPARSDERGCVLSYIVVFATSRVIETAQEKRVRDDRSVLMTVAGCGTAEPRAPKPKSSLDQ
jgi:hypothetical protein